MHRSGLTWCLDLVVILNGLVSPEFFYREHNPHRASLDAMIDAA
jgi:hypothetical protein